MPAINSRKKYEKFAVVASVLQNMQKYAFHVVVCRGRERNVQRVITHVHSHCSAHFQNLFIWWHFRCRCRGCLLTFPILILMVFITCSGFYIHLESSNPRSKGESVRFESPYVISSYKCVTFWYHMWGKHVGRLNVFVAKKLGSEILKWRLSGDQGDSWNEGSTGINNNFAYKVRKNYCKVYFVSCRPGAIGTRPFLPPRRLLVDN